MKLLDWKLGAHQAFWQGLGGFALLGSGEEFLWDRVGDVERKLWAGAWGSERELSQLLVAAPGMRFSGLFWHQGEEEVEQVPAEILYQGLLPSLPQYMVSWGALGSTEFTAPSLPTYISPLLPPVAGPPFHPIFHHSLLPRSLC